LPTSWVQTGREPPASPLGGPPIPDPGGSGGGDHRARVLRRHGQRRGEFRAVDPAEFALRELCVTSAAAELGFDST
jgi:hypothetical protein